MPKLGKMIQLRAGFGTIIISKIFFLNWVATLCDTVHTDLCVRGESSGIGSLDLSPGSTA